MKRVLLENAFEAWASAIKYCDAISCGMATLFYQKDFVSSLHNAVELFFKQILLDEGKHDVAKMRQVKNKKDAELYLDYMSASDLNRFFSKLTNEEIDKFYSIEFNKLIDMFKKVKLEDGEVLSIQPSLKRLQELRNNETHFMINRSNFLSEKDYMILYNFMIQLYKIISDYNLLPFWGDPWGEDKRLVFKRNFITSFSFTDSLKKSPLAKCIVSHLNGTIEYGSPSSTSYDIATELCREEEQMETQFDNVWTIIEMLQSNGLIHYEEIVEELPEDLYQYKQHPNVYYVMTINL